MFIGRVAIAAAAIAAPLAFAAPALAAPMDFSCAPCVNVPVEDPDNPGTFIDTPTPVWNAFFDGTNGVFGDGKGAWESGVEAANGGAWENATANGPWEKAFPAE